MFYSIVKCPWRFINKFIIIIIIIISLLSGTLSHLVPLCLMRDQVCMLGFLPVDERVSSLCLWVGKRVLTVVCAYAPNDGSALLASLGAPPGDSIVLLEDFNAHVVSESETWRGVIGRNGLTNTMFERCPLVHKTEYRIAAGLCAKYTAAHPANT